MKAWCVDKSQAQENAAVGLDAQAGMTCKVRVKREALTVGGVWRYCSCAHTQIQNASDPHGAQQSIVRGCTDHPRQKLDVWSAGSKNFLKLRVNQPAAFYSLGFFARA